MIQTDVEDDPQTELAQTRKAAYEALMAATAKKESDKRRLERAEQNAREKMQQIESRETELTKLRQRSDKIASFIQQSNEDIENRIEYFDTQKAETQDKKLAVARITEKQLGELRRYAHPPNAVVVVVKAVK